MEKRKNKRKRKRLAPQALNMANPNALGLKILFDHNDDATSTSLRNISGSSQLSVASSSAEELNAALAPNDNQNYGDWLKRKIKADKEKKRNQQAEAETQTHFETEKTVTFGGKKRKRKKKRKTRKKRGGLDNMCDNFAEKLSGEEYYQNRDDVTRKTADEYCINSESKNHVCDINTGNCIELDELGMPVISIATSDDESAGDESAGDESADIRESNGNNGAVDAAGMPIIPIRFGGKKRRKKRKRKKTKRKSHKRKRTRRKRNRKKRTRKRVKKLSSRKRK